MTAALARLLDRPAALYAASGLSLGLGLFFTFVWAPHPWGWQGIDAYHELASRLARGEPFATTDVPWGYAYFAALFYWLFGTRVWIPVLAQVVINAATPLLLYRLVRPWTSGRVAALAALITGVFSFNNVYASTQASDALCTVLFLVSLLALSRAVTTGAVTWFAIAGLLAGTVPQFRPNMVLLPGMVAAGYVLLNRRARHVVRAAVYCLFVVLALSPWIVRNYRLTGLFLPTSTHGGVQLWYGTLQVGPYLESRAHNPRSIFESSPFSYSSLGGSSLLIDVGLHQCRLGMPPPPLVYWTDRSPAPMTLQATRSEGLQHRYEVPGQPIPTVVYYSLSGDRSDPFVTLVDDRHLQDMDRHDDLLDVFDVIRLVRHLAWSEPIEASLMERLDFDRDGLMTRNDLSRAITILLPEPGAVTLLTSLDLSDQAAMIRLVDGSTVAIPSAWSGLHTDLDVRGDLAGHLVARWRTFTSLGAEPPADCRLVDTVRVNEAFYRREPHLMRRYTALAFDNIRRDVAGFVAASAYRMVRLFIIRGTADAATAHQFPLSRLAYLAGTVLSAAYLVVFLAGAAIAWRQRSALVWLLVPIVYVPLTICFVLTNMRYTVTMQPLMFVFVAVAVVAGLGLEAGRDERSAP
jgi:hypothetical protein